MFAFLKKDPVSKLNKQYAALLEKAPLAQQRGDIRTYLELSAEELAKKIDSIESSNG